MLKKKNFTSNYIFIDFRADTFTRKYFTDLFKREFFQTKIITHRIAVHLRRNKISWRFFIFIDSIKAEDLIYINSFVDEFILQKLNLPPVENFEKLIPKKKQILFLKTSDRKKLDITHFSFHVRLDLSWKKIIDIKILDSRASCQ